jgi:hypothetical protein
VLACLAYFNKEYRSNDLSRKTHQIDQLDLQNVATVVYFAGAVLLPLLSEPLNWLEAS